MTHLYGVPYCWLSPFVTSVLEEGGGFERKRVGSRFFSLDILPCRWRGTSRMRGNDFSILSQLVDKNGFGEVGFPLLKRELMAHMDLLPFPKDHHTLTVGRQSSLVLVGLGPLKQQLARGATAINDLEFVHRA